MCFQLSTVLQIIISDPSETMECLIRVCGCFNQDQGKGEGIVKTIIGSSLVYQKEYNLLNLLLFLHTMQDWILLVFVHTDSTSSVDLISSVHVLFMAYDWWDVVWLFCLCASILEYLFITLIILASLLLLFIIWIKKSKVLFCLTRLYVWLTPTTFHFLIQIVGCSDSKVTAELRYWRRAWSDAWTYHPCLRSSQEMRCEGCFQLYLSKKLILYSLGILTFVFLFLHSCKCLTVFSYLFSRSRLLISTLQDALMCFCVKYLALLICYNPLLIVYWCSFLSL